MAFVIVELNISRDEYLRWYQGGAREVDAVARDGRRVRFPAYSLQRFVQHSGIQGTFAIYFGPDNKLQRVERLV